MAELEIRKGLCKVIKLYVNFVRLNFHVVFP